VTTGGAAGQYIFGHLDARSLGAIRRAPAADMLIAKLSYWWG
jgi:hypothetical protein